MGRMHSSHRAQGTPFLPYAIDWEKGPCSNEKVYGKEERQTQGKLALGLLMKRQENEDYSKLRLGVVEMTE